jgi:UDP-N-acetylmuramate dehydrogenase
MQNIGAYGVEIKDVFESLEALEIANLENRVFDHDACDFGYRHSFFKSKGKGKYIIHSVTFKLSKRPVFNTSYGDIQATLDSLEKEASIQSISEAVIKIRQSKLPDPKVLGNAGSFFKNPSIEASHFSQIQQNHPLAPHYPQPNGTIKLPAGWLIEQCGWKGRKIGNVGVHEKQALVLVNFGGAKGHEIQDLAKQIQHSVKEKFDIELEPEVNFIGN